MIGTHRLHGGKKIREQPRQSMPALLKVARKLLLPG
jgi:hypothetical protein